MAISAGMVRLREAAGLGMMDSKKPWQKPVATWIKLSKITQEKFFESHENWSHDANGLLGVKSSEDDKRVALVEVNIETDFAQKRKFVAFVEMA